jgi:hypothetical protein
VKTYPAVLFVAARGRSIAVVIGLLAALASVGLYAAGAGPAALLFGLPLAGLTWAAMRLVAEIVEVVAETLLPR